MQLALRNGVLYADETEIADLRPDAVAPMQPEEYVGQDGDHHALLNAINVYVQNGHARFILDPERGLLVSAEPPEKAR